MQLSAYPRDNRKRNQRRLDRRFLSAGAVLVFLLLAVGAYRWNGPLAVALQSTRVFIFENSYFSVREIQVRGGEKVGGNEIVAMTGLWHGMNIWQIEPVAIEKKIARHPWVNRALVRREFPRRVVIEVVERSPRAVVALGQ